MAATAMFGVPAVPLGYDLFPVDEGDELEYPPLPTLHELQTAMTRDPTALPLHEPLLNFTCIPVVSPAQPPPSARLQSPAAASEVAKSPTVAGRSEHQQRHGLSAVDQSIVTPCGSGSGSGSGSSLSPATDLIYTPSSTLLDYDASVNGDDGDFSIGAGVDDSISPGAGHAAEDFVVVSRCRSRRTEPYVPDDGAPTSSMNNRPPPQTQHTSSCSGASSHASRTSSTAPSPSLLSFTGSAWGSFNATADRWMDSSFRHFADGSEIPASHDFSDSPAFLGTNVLHHEGFQNDGAGDLAGNNPTTQSNAIMFFPHDQHSTHGFGQIPSQPGPISHQHYLHESQQMPIHSRAFHQPQRPSPRPLEHQTMMAEFAPDGLHPQVAMPPASGVPTHGATTFYAAPSIVRQDPNPHLQSQRPDAQARRFVVPSLPTARKSPYPLPTPVGVRPQRVAPDIPAGPSENATTRVSRRPIVRVEVSKSSSNAPLPKGGRRPDTHLTSEARDKSSKMRKVAACWRCALQRDSCDEGEICSRCQMKSQKGQTYYFGCDRSKLPNLVHDFLPATMTMVHQKQTIEDYINAEVFRWDTINGIDVHLTSGYGPPMPWKLYEFQSRTGESLGQLQYLQNPQTRTSERCRKYSPPLGLLSLNTSDDSRFEQYLSLLAQPNYLWEFGWTCFEEETQVDPGAFQARVLQFMCNLYTAIIGSNGSLEKRLKEIIQMMIVTYIMGHTLTIEQDTLYIIFNSMTCSPPADQNIDFSHTSPRLANRQLKFYFHVIREDIYKSILKDLHKTLHTSVRKDETWLQSFCAVLGMAMMLEEVQRTIYVQADAKVVTGKCMPEEAAREAYNACSRIDERFELLIGLFQCKYRDRRWGINGSFGNQTPEIHNPTIHNFLQQLHKLVQARQDHLQSRKDIPLALENQCSYTSRLVARFLLPFLALPA